MEILDIVDESGMPTGQKVEREEAHSKGIRHRTSHVWILRKYEGKVQVLLQKRSVDKDSNPGKYDCSSAGHIPAGEDFVPSAIRELKEELGVEVNEDRLTYICTKSGTRKGKFHNKTFIDNQVSNVYAIWLDFEEKQFIVQKEEIESVKWFLYDECIDMIKNNRIPNCISVSELESLKKFTMKSKKTGI